jgi:NhaA family Na+:H+ antiporter
VGLVLWVFVLKSGVHATLSGVALGLAIPLRRKDGSELLHAVESALRPYVGFAILPLFAFANAGVPLGGGAAGGVTSPLSLGVALGLLLGKPMGILFAVAAATALGLAQLPRGANWLQMTGIGFLAGIGFTMSLFIGSLAFEAPDRVNAVRLGVLAGSLASMIVGLVLLARGSRAGAPAAR